MNNKGNSYCMNRIDKVGEGSYGIVYSGSFVQDPEEKVYAIKRNFKEASASWMGNIHEADVLVRLKGHPYIVEIHRISIGDPFSPKDPMTPKVSSKKDMLEDKMHFILEYMEHSGDDYLRDRVNFSYMNSRLILTQILLALEYMHNKNIVHRDLKPANILIRYDNGIPCAKICDFGMSCNYTRCHPGTPGVVTCWYRAPEICYGHSDYDFKSDIWSFGCLMYEFMTKKPWVFETTEDDTRIMNKIITLMEPDVDITEDLKYLESKSSKKLNIKTNDILAGKKTSFESQIRSQLKSGFIDFEKHCGPLSDYIDLMRKCLQLNPNNRPSLSEIMNHKFFKCYHNFMKSVRKSFITVPENEQVIINQSKERTWGVNMLIELYNKRKNYRWYNDMILFHALDLFERYLYWVNSSENTKVVVYDDETDKRGKIHTQEESELRMLVCVYVMHKYYCTLEHPRRWDTLNFYESKYNNQDYYKEAEDFEYCLVKNVCGYKIFRNTIIEMIDKFNDKYSENLTYKLLLNYCKIQNYIGSVENLYQKLNI